MFGWATSSFHAMSDRRELFVRRFRATLFWPSRRLLPWLTTPGHRTTRVFFLFFYAVVFLVWSAEGGSFGSLILIGAPCSWVAAVILRGAAIFILDVGPAIAAWTLGLVTWIASAFVWVALVTVALLALLQLLKGLA